MRAAVCAALLVIVLAAVAGCTRSEIAGVPARLTPVEPQSVDIDAISVLRDFTVAATVAEPQAEWAPGSYLMVARSVRGLMLIREGFGTTAYRTDDASSPYEPRFWPAERALVFGPEPGVTHDPATGRISIPASGLQSTAFTGETLERPVTLTEQGYRPRPWGRRVVYCIEDQILLTDADGEEEPFVAGFLPEPQPGGPGIAWQSAPVFRYDHWTGTDGNGELIVRWRAGQVDILPDAAHPRWTPWGGLVFTRLRGPLDDHDPWYAVGTDLMHLPGPGAEPVLLMRDAHLGQPHPRAPIAAALGNDGRVHLVHLATGLSRPFIDRGSRPRWSDDGRRLLLQEAGGDPDRADLHVYVLKLPGDAG